MTQPDLNTLIALQAKSDLLEVMTQVLLRLNPDVALKIIQDIRNGGFDEDFLQKATAKHPDDLDAAKTYLASRSQKLNELESICNTLLIRAQSSLLS